MPRCSIVIPAYNSAPTIDCAVQSARRQTERGVEIIVVDDASTDSTGEAIGRHAEQDPRVVVLRNASNGGKSVAMNRAQAVAKGEWIGVLDADDAWLPDRASRLIDAAEAAGADVVADNQLKVDPFERTRQGRLFDLSGERLTLDLPAYLGSIDRKVDFGTLKPIVRRDFLERTGVAYDETQRFSQDFSFMLELLLEGARVLVVNEALYLYTLPFSARRRKWTATGAGAWRHDFASALRSTERYLHDPRVLRQPQIELLLRRRAALLRKSGVWDEVKRRRFERGAPAALVYLLLHPPALRIVGERLLRGRFIA